MRAVKASIFLVFPLLLGIISCSRPGGKMADLVFINGKIWTVNQNQPWAEALAIENGRIIAVGRTKEIKEFIGPDTRRIDLHGALALPGFIDSHTHFMKGGNSLTSIQLRDVTSKIDFIKRFEQKTKELEPGEWILEGNWDHEQFSPPELPRKEWIDAITPDNPVCVTRYDLHMALANSLALKMAGITKHTPSPEGGEILKDPQTGEPTGILRDSAISLVMGMMPEPSLRTRVRAVSAALQHAREMGVTSVNDMNDASNFASSFEVYQELNKRGELTVRIYFYLPIDKINLMKEFRFKTPVGDEFLTIGGLKGFVDGGVGASTAYFFEPYSDNPSSAGLLATQMFPEGIMNQRLKEADSNNMQVAIHAIGDRANAIILDMFSEINKLNGPRDRRWRIEHAQHLRPADIKRFSQLGVIASVQPYHAVDDGRWLEKRIGSERCATAYAFKSLLDSGAVLAFGSDWPVAPLSPIIGIQAAVTRQTIDGKNPDGWHPEQKISLAEAIKAYTLNAAYAQFADHIKGSLEPGKLADLIVLDKNLFEIPPDKIQETKVIMTVLGGRIIYDASGL